MRVKEAGSRVLKRASGGNVAPNAGARRKDYFTNVRAGRDGCLDEKVTVQE